jgi:hypothetical protein
LALERLDVEKDIEYFVSNHGTGSAIPEPPPFINYSAAEPTPIKPASRPANFARNTNRPQSYMAKLAPSNSVTDDEPSDAGTAGVGAGHSRAGSRSNIAMDGTGPAIPVQPSQLPINVGQHAPTLPPVSTSSGPMLPPMSSAPNLGYHQQKPSVGSVISNTGYSQTMPNFPPGAGPSNRRGSYQAPIDHNSQPEYGPGQSQYKSDTIRDPQNMLGGPSDPIAQQLMKLREAPTGDSVRSRGTIGRNSMQSHQPPSSVHGSTSNQPTSPSMTNLSPPGQGPGVDYSAQADAVVGSHPSSRPSSPQPNVVPYAAKMQPPNARSTSPLPVEKVMSQYEQAFPGERSVSRNNSVNAQDQRGRPLEQPASQARRSPSPGGFAGVGAQGRSPSPQPFRQGGPSGGQPTNITKSRISNVPQTVLQEMPVPRFVEPKAPVLASHWTPLETS